MSDSATAAVAVSVSAVRTTKLPPWVFYGILFGFLGAASIVLFGPIGVSGTYPRFIGALLSVFDPSYAESNPYLVKMGTLLRPETFLVVGLLIGGFVGARANREQAPACEMIHPRETSTRNRYQAAFIGGCLIIFGSRIAGGCTSGHIISGITQLSISGFIFGAGVFATGILTAKFMHARRAGGV